MLGASPEPSAAFSALATTKSNPSRLRSPATERVTIRSPGLPTISPIKSIRILTTHQLTTQLPSHIRKPRLPHHRHLDFPRIGKLLLKRLRNITADFGRFHVVRVLGA